MPRVGGGCPRPATRTPAPIAPAAPLSSPEVQEVRAEVVAKKGVKAIDKLLTEGVTRPRKKVNVSSNRHKSWHEEEGSKSHASKSYEWVRVADEAQTPRPRRPKSMKELCHAPIDEKDEGYYALQMTDLP
ncbi:hypothetical protein BHM03_00050568 [Ensete ventricosum]|nr:hypothetical protein BHM03_00050568 [Ensete ventricosum]